MTKKDMMRWAEKLLKDIENREEFCERCETDIDDFYPLALGWLEAGLDFIKNDGKYSH